MLSPHARGCPTHGRRRGGAGRRGHAARRERPGRRPGHGSRRHRLRARARPARRGRPRRARRADLRGDGGARARARHQAAHAGRHRDDRRRRRRRGRGGSPRRPDQGLRRRAAAREGRGDPRAALPRPGRRRQARPRAGQPRPAAGGGPGVGGERLVAEAAGLYLDYSKNRVTDETLRLLLDLARSSGVAARRDAMFAGEKINVTEQRAVLHVALRAPRGARIVVDGEDVVPRVHAVLDRMADFAGRVRSGGWTGFTGRPIRNVVNIGIGGSDLGPAMAADALRWYGDRRLTLRFVSNVDGADFVASTRDLDPQETLFVVASKTFTTIEALTNARTPRAWCVRALGDERAVAKHFVAVSTATAEVRKFGIDPANMFEFWDWVGGRYSLWSAIGLSLMIAIGPAGFGEFFVVANAIDEQYRTAPFEKNLPVLLGLLGIWYDDFFDAQSVAILPYDHYLGRFSAYLEQLDMESNGKSVTLDGKP